MHCECVQLVLWGGGDGEQGEAGEGEVGEAGEGEGEDLSCSARPARLPQGSSCEPIVSVQSPDHPPLL